VYNVVSIQSVQSCWHCSGIEYQSGDRNDAIVVDEPDEDDFNLAKHVAKMNAMCHYHNMRSVIGCLLCFEYTFLIKIVISVCTVGFASSYQKFCLFVIVEFIVLLTFIQYSRIGKGQHPKETISSLLFHQLFAFSAPFS